MDISQYTSGADLRAHDAQTERRAIIGHPPPGRTVSQFCGDGCPMVDIAILKWAAGVACAPAVSSAQNDAKQSFGDNRSLADLLNAHRLDARFAARCRKENPTWCDSGTLAAATSRAELAREHIRVQCEAVRELMSQLPTERPVIVLKGASVYALTGDPDCAHHSGDIDLLCDDTAAVRTALAGLGYRPVSVDMMVRGDLAIETRNTFAFHDYPTDLHRNWVSSGHGRLFESDRNEECPGSLAYDDVAPRCVHGATTETCDLFFPDPVTTALILCGHIAFDYARGAYYTAPVVRLGELADVRDLTRVPGFDRARFLEMAARHGAERNAALVGRMIASFLDQNGTSSGRLRAARSPKNPLPAPRCDAWELRTPAPPQRLRIFLGVWVAPRRADDVLWRDMSVINSNLGTTELRAAAEWCEAVRHRTRSHGPRRVHAVVRDSMSCPAVEIGARWTEEYLELEITVLGGSPRYRPDMLTFRFDRNKGSGWDVREHEVEQQYGISAAGPFERVDGGYRVRAAFPWSVRPGSKPDDEAVNMLIALVRWKTPQEESTCLCRTPGRHCAEDLVEGVAHTAGLVAPLRILNPGVYHSAKTSFDNDAPPDR